MHFCWFSITVIFHPVIKTLWKLYCVLFGRWQFEREKQFAEIIQIFQKMGQTLIYWIFGSFLTYLRSNLISQCVNTQIICTKIFIKFLLQDKKWERLHISKNTSCRKKMLWLGRTCHMFGPNFYGANNSELRRFETNVFSDPKLPDPKFFRPNFFSTKDLFGPDILRTYIICKTHC